MQKKTLSIVFIFALPLLAHGINSDIMQAVDSTDWTKTWNPNTAHYLVQTTDYNDHWERKTQSWDSLTTTNCYHTEGYRHTYTLRVDTNLATGEPLEDPVYLPFTTYNYYYRDHLGNNIAVWNATYNQLIQHTSYYPSGLPMPRSYNQQTQTFKYNGKEFVTAEGINEYEYGFRNYNATIGRFNTIDPLTEQTPWESPYSYAGNNPINFLDYLGLEKIIAVDTTKNAEGSANNESDMHIAKAAEAYPENDGVIHVWVHGSSNIMKFFENGVKKHIKHPHDFVDFLDNMGVVLWKNRENTTFIIVLHSCQAGQGENSLAQQISADDNFHNIVIVAPTEMVAITNTAMGYRENGTMPIVLTGKHNGVTTVDSKGNIQYGSWRMFLNGKQVNSFIGSSLPFFKNPEKILQHYGQ